jgi:hypothetical protein
MNLSLAASIFIGLGSGSLGTLLTILLTPGLQHHFWTRQRRFELCLANITEIRRLTAHMLFELLDAIETAFQENERENPQRVHYRPDPASTKAWFAARIEAKNLFSTEALQPFKYLDNLMFELGGTFPSITPLMTLTEDGYSPTLDRLWEARDVAVRALYRDIGIQSKSSLHVRLRNSAPYHGLRRLMGHPVSIEEEVYGPEIQTRDRRVYFHIYREPRGQKKAGDHSGDHPTKKP